MSTTTKATIPIRLLFEAVPHNVSVELKSGETYRGKLVSVESSMNCLLEGVTKTNKDGQTQTLEQVYLRGAQIRLFALPEMLKHSRILGTNSALKAAGGGRGRGKVVK